MSEIRYRRPAILDRIPRDNHAVIEAGAGCGKTHTIEHLVLDLLLSTPCTLEEILVVTFTEKATTELRSRIRALLEQVLSAGAPIGAASSDEVRTLDETARAGLETALFSFDHAPIFTIHGFCQRALTELAFDSGVSFGLAVVDSRGAFHTSFRAELRESLAAEPAARAILSAWLGSGAPAARESLTGSLEDLLYKSYVNRYMEMRRDHATAGDTPLEVRAVDWFLPRVVDRFGRDKREKGQIDYDDMLIQVWRAIDGPRGDAIVTALRARLRYAVVDEFQDTDDLQWRIFHRIFVASELGNLLYVVGDPKQAIYGFRGADVFSYLRARKELRSRGAATVPLTRNFRSTSDLIGACNLIFDQQAAAPIFTGEIRHDAPAECGKPKLRLIDAVQSPLKPVTIFRYLPDAAPGSAPRMRAAIGRRIAMTLRRILSEEPHRITIEDQDNRSRRVEPNDVFILTRSGAESVEIGGYLREFGVRFAFYKQDGLFQTSEASDVLDVLRAVEDPGNRSHRLKAWMSPFFGVPFAQIAGIGEAPAGHPLNEHLFEWKALADEERFVELFDRLRHESGLVDRELLLSNSERELTNYLHVLEILLEEALRERLSLRELIARLEAYVAGTALPPGTNGNVQRIESERRAVQVMTVHMSKGLEADVVFLFGGTGRAPDRSPVAIYHDGYERRLAIGKAEKDSAKAAIRAEEEQENERLIYVALTRARAQLYLPFFPDSSLKRKVNGYYARLNDRLAEIVADRTVSARLFEIEDVDDRESARSTADLGARLASWSPPQALIRDDRDGPPQPLLDDLRGRHAPLIIRSYTALERSARRDFEPEDFKRDLEGATEAADLPGGRSVGIFLHEVIEKLDLTSLAEPIDLVSWKRRDDVARLFAETMRRYQVRDPRWTDRGPEIVFNTLRAPIELREGVAVGPLYRCPSVREMEFLYPIPESSHPLLDSHRAGAWTVARGYLKGFVDFVFEHGGVTYFADWKSDLLASYELPAIEAHVRRHYELQAAIYSVGIVRLLRIRSEAEYNARFGGLLYLFIRGIRPDGNGRDGVYFRRPSWDEIARCETDLIRVAPPIEAVAREAPS